MNSRIFPIFNPFKPIEYNLFQTYVIFYETPFN